MKECVEASKRNIPIYFCRDFSKLSSTCLISEGIEFWGLSLWLKVVWRKLTNCVVYSMMIGNEDMQVSLAFFILSCNTLVCSFWLKCSSICRSLALHEMHPPLCNLICFKRCSETVLKNANLLPSFHQTLV